VRLTVVAGGSYVALFTILLGQALNGESVAAPGAMSLAILIGWAALTGAAAWLVVGRTEPRAQALVY